MKKDKALKIAESVLEQVGGKQNIAKVLHCQTRLRFNLKDESIANHEKIEAVQGVLGVVRAGGQVQIVIGPEVKDVYNELCELGDFDNTDREPVSAAKEKNHTEIYRKWNFRCYFRKHGTCDSSHRRLRIL